MRLKSIMILCMFAFVALYGCEATDDATTDGDIESSEASDADKDGEGTETGDVDKDGEGAETGDADKDGEGAETGDADKDGEGAETGDADKDGEGNEGETVADGDATEHDGSEKDKDGEGSGETDSDMENSGTTWKDSTSGLIWQNSSTADMDWEQAKTYCTDLVLDGHDDWRLPTVGEQRSLVKGCDSIMTGGGCPLTDDCLQDNCYENATCQKCTKDAGPADGCYWPKNIIGDCGDYWSATTRPAVTTRVWLVRFAHGHVDGEFKSAKINTRCVREDAATDGDEEAESEVIEGETTEIEDVESETSETEIEEGETTETSETEVEDDTETTKTYFVGYSTKKYTRATTRSIGVEIPVEIRYPSDTDPKGADTPMATGSFPLVIFAHGYKQSYDDYTFIWEELVKLGFIVILPNRINTAATIDVDEYTKDLEFLYGKILDLNGESSSLFYGHVTDTKSAFMGHSTGAGADFNTVASILSKRIPAPTTIVSIAPLGDLDDAATISGTNPIEAAKNVNIPSLIIDGTEDCITPPNLHSEKIYDNIATGTSKYRASIKAGDHCGFCDNQGSGFSTCTSGEALYKHCVLPNPLQGTTIPHSTQNDLAMSLIVPWLKHYLLDDSDAFADFKVALSSNDITFEKEN